jgi:hypothetical protein
MQTTTEVRARWLGGAFLCATLMGLVMLASRSPVASAADADPAVDAALLCEADAHAVDANAEIDQMLQDVRMRLEQEGAVDGEAIVLNNRGYNYGPTPSVRIDSFLAERATPYER